MPNPSLAANNGGTLALQMNEHKTSQSSLAATPEEALDFSFKKMSETFAASAAFTRPLKNSKIKNKNIEKMTFLSNANLIVDDLQINRQTNYHNNQHQQHQHHDTNDIHSPVGTSSSSFISDLTPFISDDCASSTNSNSTR